MKSLDIRDNSQTPELQAEWQAITESAAKFKARWGWEVACVSAPNRQSMRARLVNVLGMWTEDVPESSN